MREGKRKRILYPHSLRQLSRRFVFVKVERRSITAIIFVAPGVVKPFRNVGNSFQFFTWIVIDASRYESRTVFYFALVTIKRFSEKKHLSAVFADGIHYTFERRGFSRAVSADESRYAAFCDFETYVAQFKRRIGFRQSRYS